MPMFSNIADTLKTAPVESPVDSFGRALTLRSLIDQRAQARQIGQQNLEIHRQTLADHQRAARIADATQAAYAAGGTDDEIAANIRKVNAPASFQFDKDRRENRKNDLENQLNQIKVDHEKAQELGSIAGAMVDEGSFHKGIGKALVAGYVKPDEAAELLSMPWGPDAQARVNGYKASALSVKDQLAAHAKEAADELARLDSEAKRPGLVADSKRKVEETGQITRPVLDAAGKPVLNPDGTPKTQGMTDKDTAAVAGAAETRAQTAKRDANTAKYQEQRIGIERQKAAQEAAGGGSLTDDDYKRAGAEFAITGVMPALGNGSGPVKQRMIHEKMQFARQSGLTPKDMALAGAAFKGDSKSMAALKVQRDQIVSFEQTAQKNLDLFLKAASKIPDTGVPWLNMPLRILDEKLVGSANISAVNAARQVANNEIAKVTSGGGLGGVLSDSARHEVASYNPQSATLKQTLAVAKVLKQDMANRHESMDQAIGAIGDRMGNFGGAISPAAGGGAKADPMGLR